MLNMHTHTHKKKQVYVQYTCMAQQKSQAMHVLLVEIHINQKYNVTNAIVSIAF